MTLTLNLNTSKILTLTLIGILFSFAYLIFVTHSFAQTTPKQARENLITAKKETRIAKLDAAKLRVCKNKERVIINRLDALTRLVATQETSFDKIAARVENFYTEKVLTAGKTVANYNNLVTDIAAKKAAVDASLATAKTNSSNFSCSADDPKGDLTQFKTDMQAVKNALKDYRTSIKNLIVAIKSVVGEEESPSPTPTPTP